MKKSEKEKCPNRKKEKKHSRIIENGPKKPKSDKIQKKSGKSAIKKYEDVKI